MVYRLPISSSLACGDVDDITAGRRVDGALTQLRVLTGTVVIVHVGSAEQHDGFFTETLCAHMSGSLFTVL